MNAFFEITISEVGNNPQGLFDSLYVYFNWFEAFSWFALSLFIWLRYLKRRRTALELIYGLYVCLFGVTDVLEVHKLTFGLLAFKGVVLLSILVCRHYVLQQYQDTQWKL